jgi:protein TonB
MKQQHRAFHISIILHSIIILILLVSTTQLKHANKPIIIDFSMQDTVKTKSHQPEMKILKEDLRNKNNKNISQAIPESPLMPVPSDMRQPLKEIKEQALSTEINEGSSTTSFGSVKDSTSISHDVITKPASISGAARQPEQAQNIESPNRYLKEHLSYIRDVIQSKINYPRIARQMGWEGKVKVSFIVCMDGSVKEITITEGSGKEILDKNAIDTIRKASPFPKPPVEAQIIVPIKYSLN